MVIYSTPPLDNAVQVAEKNPKKNELRLTPDYISQHEEMKPPFTLEDVIKGFSLTENYKPENYGSIEIYAPKHDKKLITTDDISPDFYQWLMERNVMEKSCEHIGKLFSDYCAENYDMKNILNIMLGEEKKIYNISFFDGELFDVDNFFFTNMNGGNVYDEITLRTRYLFGELGIGVSNGGDGYGVLNLGITPLKIKTRYMDITGDFLPLSTDRNDKGNRVVAGRIKGYLKFGDNWPELWFRKMWSTKQGRYSVRFSVPVNMISPRFGGLIEDVFGCEASIGVMKGSGKVEKGTGNPIRLVIVLENKK